MRGHIVLLLSLLCVAQALPFSLDGDAKPPDLSRIKRHEEHANIADREVRTIISAIVDAILDGDKKKRSDITTEEPNEDTSPGNVSVTSDTMNVEKHGHINATNTSLGDSSSSSADGSGEVSDGSTTEQSSLDSSGSAGNPSGESSGESSSGSGSGDENQVESGDSEDDGQEKGTFGAEGQDELAKSVNPTSTNTARMKRDEDAIEENQDVNSMQVPSDGNMLVIKRDIKESVPMNDSMASSVQIDDQTFEESGKPSESGSGSGSGTSQSSDEEISLQANTATAASDVIDSDEVDRRDRIPHDEIEENDKLTSLQVPTASLTENVAFVSTVSLKNGTSTMNFINTTGNIVNTFGDDNSAEDLVEENDVNSSGSAFSSAEIESSADLEYGSTMETPNTLSNHTVDNNKPNNIVDHQQVQSDVNVKTPTATNQLEQSKDDNTNLPAVEANDIEIVEDSETSGDDDKEDEEVVNKKEKLETLNEIVSDMAKAAIENAQIGKGGYDEENDDGDTKGSVVKKSIVPFDVDEDSMVAESLDPNLLITTTEEDMVHDSDETDDVEKRSSIPVEDDGYVIEIERRSHIPTDEMMYADEIAEFDKRSVNYDTPELINEAYINEESSDATMKRSTIPEAEQYKNSLDIIGKRSFIPHDLTIKGKQQGESERKRTNLPIFQGTSQTSYPQNISMVEEPKQKKVDEALHSLVKLILNEDPSIRKTVEEISDQKLNKEEKLERDLIDMISRQANKKKHVLDDDETKEKVITEVKDFEGYMQALSQQKSLSPWKHDTIVKKFERDLLDHLSVPDPEDHSLSEQADELTQYSEMDFIKDKIMQAEENTARFANLHANNLDEIKRHAIASLRPIIEQLPLQTADINELVDSVSRSAWLRMVSNIKKNKYATKKMRRNLRVLLQ